MVIHWAKRLPVALAMLIGPGCTEGLERDCGTLGPGDPGAGDTPAFAVVLSDFQSTSIGLLDKDAAPLTECWIDSGSRAPGLVAALSGDVVLSTDQPAGALSIIDRFGTDVYSVVSLSAPAVLGQVRLQDAAVSGAFSANPHDAVTVSSTSTWVSRYAGNTDADAPAVARGSDLLEIDPSRFVRTGRRISFEDFIVAVTVDTDGGPVTKQAYPRPSRMVRVGSQIFVGLSRLTLEFDGAGPGAVAVVDVESGSTRLHSLDPTVANCGRVVPVPGEPDLVAVGCIGFSRPFGDEAQVRDTAGLFVLRVEGDDVRTVSTWRTNAEPGRPLAVAEVVAVDATTLVALDYGRSSPVTPDRVYSVDMVNGRAELLFESAQAFQVGAGVFAQGWLLVPDADVGLRRFRRSEVGFVADPTLMLDGGGLRLPPRSVYSLQ